MDVSQVEGGSFVPFLAAVAAAPLTAAVAGFLFLRRCKMQKQQVDLSDDAESKADESDGKEEEESRLRIEEGESRQRIEEEESVQRIEERESRRSIKERESIKRIEERESRKRMQEEDLYQMLRCGVPREEETRQWIEEGIYLQPVGGDSRQWIGKLICFNDRAIATGYRSSLVEGTFNGRSVAVKHCKHPDEDLVGEEITTLMDRPHRNVVGYFCIMIDYFSITIGMHRATCSLEDLISDKNQSILGDDIQLWNPSKTNYPSTHLLNLMRDLVSGLAHLHQLGIVHHDLRPHHVLVFKYLKLSILAKLSDVGLKRRYGNDYSGGDYRRASWRAPEHQPEIDWGALSWIPNGFWHGQQTGDLFSLGCILFYCITGGKHPYGDCSTHDSSKLLTMNIKSDRKDLSSIESTPEAVHLISHLLNPNPNMRPKAQEVLEHPLFWTSDQRLLFLRDACDHVLELGDSELSNALENTATENLVGNWDEDSEVIFLNSIGTGNGSSKFDTATDLLRLIRNTFIYHA